MSLRDFFGTIEASIVDGIFCEECRDVHMPDECPKLRLGDCNVHGTVTLDKWGNCPTADWRRHRITNRRPKPIRKLRSV
jgi:hypothetical protein